MATYQLKDFQQTVGTGAGDWTYTVTTPGLYHVSAFLNMVPPNTITVAIQHNAVTVIDTGSLQSSTSQYNLDCFIPCAAADVIDILVVSTNADDADIMTVKSVFNLRLGS